MLKCRLGSPSSVKTILQRNLSHNKLYGELKRTGTRLERLQKTYPTEVRVASNPPVAPNKSKDELNRKVLKALARANENAMKKGRPILPTKEVWLDTEGGGRSKSTISDDCTGPRNAGTALAEQLILKYPESFKIRFSDNMSRPKLSHVKGLCRDMKMEELEKLSAQVLSGRLALSTSDFEAIIAFFAQHNVSTALTEWPLLFDPITKTSSYSKTFDDPEKKDRHTATFPVPYCMSLLKTVDVECRNVNLAIEKLIHCSEEEIPEHLKEERVLMTFNEKFGGGARKSVGIASSKFIQDPKIAQLKGIKTEEREEPDRQKNHNATLPQTSDDQFISVMDENALCLQLLGEMGDKVTAKAYCSVIQSAVRFYNPEIGWKMYLEMRERNLYPDEKTFCDLLYSITHEMPPERFIEEGAPIRISGLFQDLMENPKRKLTDEVFLYSFYGVHTAPPPHEYIQLEHNPATGARMQEEATDKLEAVLHKYNYQILEDMQSLMESGQLKLRFSTAFKMITMLNMTVGDEPKSHFTRDFNTALYDLSIAHPEAFIRDELAGTDCSSFLKVLLSLARTEIPHYNPAIFYKAHKDNICALLDHAAWNPQANLYFPLDHVFASLCKDLNEPKEVQDSAESSNSTNEEGQDSAESIDSMIEEGQDSTESSNSTVEEVQDSAESSNSTIEEGQDSAESSNSTVEEGQESSQRSYSTIEEMQEVSVFTLYNEIIQPRLENIPAFEAFRCIRGAYLLLDKLDRTKVDPSYYISCIDWIITAVEEVDKRCYWPENSIESANLQAYKGTNTVSFGWGQSSTDNLYRAIEGPLHKLAIEYLPGVPKSLLEEEETAAATDLTQLDMSNAELEPVKLSEEDIHNIISLTTRGIQLLIKHEGIPTVHMAMLLASKVIEAGEWQRGWQVINMFNSFDISIENSKIWLLSMIQLTPDWATNGEECLSTLYEPLQSSVREIIRQHEDAHCMSIAELIRGPKIKDHPLLQQSTSVGFRHLLNSLDRTFRRLRRH